MAPQVEPSPTMQATGGQEVDPVEERAETITIPPQPLSARAPASNQDNNALPAIVDTFGKPRTLQPYNSAQTSGTTAAANPNTRNLLLEVPYKRGVRTTSINQRFLNHAPAFEAAFELMPSSANFGVLRTGCLYRLPFKLVNVSCLQQRFNIKGGSSALKVVCNSKGRVAAAGMTVHIEIEVGSETPLELHEVVTLVTERESISLPVTASILTEEAYDKYLNTNRSTPPLPAGAAVPRLLSTSMRDQALLKTMRLQPGDADAGRKRVTAPPRVEPVEAYTDAVDDEDELSD